MNPNAIRASAGTIFSVPIAAAPTPEVIGWLRRGDIRIVAARDADSLYTDADLTGPRARLRQRGGWPHRCVASRRHRRPPPDARRRRQPGTSRSRPRSSSTKRDGSATPCGLATLTAMDLDVDVIVIGAGPGGEAAAHKARALGAAVAVLDRKWFGGAARTSAACHRRRCSTRRQSIGPTRRDTSGRASKHRDFMINRPADAAEPDDSIHVSALDKDGAVVYRGDARIVGKGRVSVSHDGARHAPHRADVVIAVGSNSRPIRIPGIEKIDVWTNEQATLTRELPRSLLILGGGPTGCELAQVYARFGVPVTIVQSGPRLAPTDIRNSDVVRATLENDGVKIRTGVRAIAARAGAGQDGAHVIDLDDGSTAWVMSCSRRSGARCRSTTWVSSITGSRVVARRPTRATGGCASPRGCMRWAMQAGQSSTRIRRITRASWPRG